jgi:YggT family protein
MGRPWWYDSYWERKEKRQRRLRWPSRKSWAWLALVVLSLVLTISSTGFQPDLLDWLFGFVGYFCRILALAIFLRTLLTWFRVRYYSWPVIILNDLSDPILMLLRRTMPAFGGFDFSPLVAIMALYFIPSIFKWLVLLVV